ncbi:uncharacterized protein GVI51_F00715 [Nakaseomyces glabratus]|nr:uncharacterized protein GVI51_F00715 [Nakaseomyces glabratus]
MNLNVDPPYKFDFITEPCEIHGPEYTHLNNPEYVNPKPMKGLKLQPLPGDDVIEREKNKLKVRELWQKKQSNKEMNIFQRKFNAYKDRFDEYQGNMTLLKKSITEDFQTKKEIFFYPFKGITFDYKNGTSENGPSTMTLKYLMCMVADGSTFALVFGPAMTMVYSLFLGPIAIALVIVQVILVSNYLALMDTRRDTDKLGALVLGNVFTTLNLNQFVVFTQTINIFQGDTNIRLWRRITSAEFLVDTLPNFLIDRSIEILDYIFIVACFFIPFFGITIVQLIFAGQNGFAYFQPYFKELRKMDEKELRKVYYQNYSKWYLYGVACAVIESLPFLSGYLQPSLFVGASLWSARELKEEVKLRTKKFGPIQPQEST